MIGSSKSGLVADGEAKIDDRVALSARTIHQSVSLALTWRAPGDFASKLRRNRCATFYLHIGQRSIPRQIDLAFDEGLDQGIVVCIKHPLELDAMPAKVGPDSSEYIDVGW